MYSMLNKENPIVQQEIQYDKENYIANRIIKILINEEYVDKDECERILKIVSNKVVG